MNKRIESIKNWSKEHAEDIIVNAVLLSVSVALTREVYKAGRKRGFEIGAHQREAIWENFTGREWELTRNQAIRDLLKDEETDIWIKFSKTGRLLYSICDADCKSRGEDA